MTSVIANCRDTKHRWKVAYKRGVVNDLSWVMRCGRCRCECIWRPWPDALDGGQT